MLDAYKKGKQVVQVGTQQRSWDHFIEVKKTLDTGVLGNVTHIYIVQPDRTRVQEAEQPVPAGLDWKGSRVRRRAGPSNRAVWRFVAGTTTAAGSWPTGARTTSTWPTGS